MKPITEIEALATLDKVFIQLDNVVTRDRVLRWAWDKYGSKTGTPLHEPLSTNGRQTKIKANKKAKKPNGEKSTPKSRQNPSIIKDLNLSPKGKKTFKAFSEEKNPIDNQEKCTVAVYYLQKILEINNIGISHVYTCYKDMNWKVPILYNVLTDTARNKGWVDTSDTAAISITIRGENFVEHDLPGKVKA